MERTGSSHLPVLELGDAPVDVVERHETIWRSVTRIDAWEDEGLDQDKTWRDFPDDPVWQVVVKARQ